MVRVNKPEYEFEIKKIEQFCDLYQFKFPQEFVEYLKQYNDAELEPNEVNLGDNECGIRFFYGTSDYEYCDIWAMYECYIGRMPDNCVPIADPDFGNQICMSLSKETYGRIYFWDHETMDTDDDGVCTITFDDMYEIATSFTELLDKILWDESTMCINLKQVSAKDIFDKILRWFDTSSIYMLEIKGANLDGFLEDIKSDNYLLIKDNKHFFFKDLDELFVLTNELEDVEVFINYIGQYNEGSMYFYILKDGFELCNRQQIFEAIQKNKLLTVEVEDDGDALEIFCKNEEKIQVLKEELS